MEVRRGEQRVVVEHLLEVRHEPGLVDGVAVEAAAEEVVHAARGHRVERRRAPSAARPRRRGGACGAGTRASRPAGTWAPAPTLPTPGRTAPRSARAASPSRLSVSGSDEGASSLERRTASTSAAAWRGDVAALIAVGVRDRRQHLPEARQPVPRLGREVRAAEERLALGRAERPSSASRPGRSARRPRPCRASRRRAAPRGRP